MKKQDIQSIAKIVKQLSDFSNLDEFEVLDCIEGIVFDENVCSEVECALEKMLEVGSEKTMSA